MHGHATKDYYGSSLQSEVENSQTGYTSFTIPDTVIDYNNEAFANCVCLKRIRIPGNLEGKGGRMDEAIFKNCINLTDIYFEGGENPYNHAPSYSSSAGWKGTNCYATVHWNS